MSTDPIRAALSAARPEPVGEGEVRAAIDVIESVAGFDDETTSVGEAWAIVLRQLSATPQQPAPGEGEVGDETRYLVKELRDQADDLSPSLELFGLIHCAADLIEQQAATIAALSAAPPEPVGEGEVGELVEWLKNKGAGCWPCPDGFSARARAEEYEFYSGLTRAADLIQQQAATIAALQQPAPGEGEGLTDEELWEMFQGPGPFCPIEFARAVESAAIAAASRPRTRRWGDG